MCEKLWTLPILLFFLRKQSPTTHIVLGAFADPETDESLSLHEVKIADWQNLMPSPSSHQSWSRFHEHLPEFGPQRTNPVIWREVPAQCSVAVRIAVEPYVLREEMLECL
jgi:hypothetical protein